jgi:hypothetical protein
MAGSVIGDRLAGVESAPWVGACLLGSSEIVAKEQKTVSPVIGTMRKALFIVHP